MMLSSARVTGRLALIAFVATFIALVAAAWAHNPGGRVPKLYAASGGPIDVLIDSGGGTFLFSPALCNDNMTPLSQCDASIDVSNVGDFPMSYTIATWADADGVDSGDLGPGDDATVACFNVNLEEGGADGDAVGNSSVSGPIADGPIGVGTTVEWGIEASVDDTNACQGATTTVIVIVIAEGDVPPAPVQEVVNQQQQPTTQQQQAPVNEVAAVRALPQTGSGGIVSRGSLDDLLLAAAAVFLVSGVWLTGLSRRRDTD